MQATIIRIRMQIQKLRDELACLENQVDLLEKDTKKKIRGLRICQDET